MAKPENPPAFPCEAQGDCLGPPAHDYIQTGIHTAKFPGMTLRDHFAGLALASMGTWTPCDGAGYAPGDQGGVWKAKAEWAYGMADAMLSARQTTDMEDGK